MVETTYGTRASMPERVELENVAFEGFLVRRRVVERIGLPDASYFIFYDDVDFAVRARRAGFPIWALRDAVLVRQLDFDQQHDLAGWKGYYMYRNLFAVHLRYGENAAVRAKPWVVAAGVAGPLIVNAFLDARGTPGALVAADYRPALLTMVGVLVVGFVANLLVRSVNAKFHEPVTDPASKTEGARA
ncbi:hypothetical protein [Streptomyces rhizosphaericus]|uniref:Glycosyltransferase 2-like domain-containing protein n=1 Tax=Streptomyces rhizosphaericus TaxID=114699 RepID=A0ABN1SWJ2_9ACTN